jgi:hypothetical protein
VKWQTDLYCGAVPFEDLTRQNFARNSNLVLAADGSDDSQEPLESGLVFTSSCNGTPVNPRVAGNTATIEVGEPVTLTLITYRKNGVSVLPQKFEDGVTQSFTAPGTYTMTVKVVQ